VANSTFTSLSGGRSGAREIRIIFFDAAGTLFHLPRGVGWHYRDVALRHGWDLSEEDLRRAFRAVWREMPSRPASRAPRDGDDKSWWRELVERVLDRCGAVSVKGRRDDYFEELYCEFTKPGVWELYPEVLEVLAALRPRFRIGVISNFDGRLRAILKHLGLGDAFDPLIISSEVGADKPDAWIFEQALAQAGVEPDEAWHVGDDPSRDWQGAAAAGLQVFRLSRPENSLRDLHRQLVS
jgi:putative hydrolase of the HAD superfamily